MPEKQHICSYCGYTMADTDRFCVKCGTAQPKPGNSPHTYGQTTPTDASNTPWWQSFIGFRSRTPWKMAVAAVAYVFMIGTLFSSCSDTTDSKNSTRKPDSAAVKNEQKAPQKQEKVKRLKGGTILPYKESDFIDLVMFLKVKDNAAIAQMVAMKKAVLVEAGTKVTVLKTDGNIVYIEVDEGPHWGVRGYTLTIGVE